MLSTDKNILDVESAVAKRMVRYGTLTNKLTLLVLGVGDRTVLDLSPTVHVVFPGGSSRREVFKNALWEGMREGRELPASLISTQDPFFVGFVGWRIARALHVPLQSQVHTDFLSPQYYMSSFRRFFEVLLAFFILTQSSCVRVVSKRIADRLSFIPRKKITVLPIRISHIKTESPCPSDFSQGPRVLMVSRLEPEKRVHRALHALARVPNAHLYIIGDGSLRKGLEREVQRLRLDGRVHFLGWRENIHAYYQHADAFLHVSRFEGYGLALVEAALSGLPIVSTDVGVVGSLLKKDRSVVVVSPTAGDIASALNRLFSDHEFAQRIGDTARTTAETELVDEEKYLSRYKKSLEHCLK